MVRVYEAYTEGYIVFICDENMLRKIWRRGRVIKLYRVADGVVRQVDIATVHGHLCRPCRSWPYWMLLVNQATWSTGSLMSETEKSHQLLFIFIFNFTYYPFYFVNLVILPLLLSFTYRLFALCIFMKRKEVNCGKLQLSIIYCIWTLFINMYFLQK